MSKHIMNGYSISYIRRHCVKIKVRKSGVFTVCLLGSDTAELFKNVCSKKMYPIF